MYINAVDPDFLCTDYYPYMEPWNQVMTKFHTLFCNFAKLQFATGPLCIQHPPMHTIRHPPFSHFPFTNHPPIFTV